MPNSKDPNSCAYVGALVEPNSTSFFRWTVLPERPKLTRMNTQTMPHRGERSYFRGDLTEFSVPLLTPGTDFQHLVWSRLRAIPSGTTRSYGGIAAEIGRPTAVRAVARANGDNRIAILIPCHRVIGSDGKLTGYGGGLWRKQRLLEIEQGA